MRAPALLARPVLAPVLLGALTRLVAATVGSGFHARDDYFHVLAPAWRWVTQPDAAWDTGPGALIRSHLVPRLVQGVLELQRALGIDSPDLQLAGIEIAFGLWSLLVIPALYVAGKRLFDERTARIAAWLGALHFIMPYAGTRMLLGAAAMPAVAWAVALLSPPTQPQQRSRELVLAGACMGLAVWLRYPTVVAVVPMLAIGLSRQGSRALAWCCLGLGGVLALQGVFDLVTTGRWFGPLLANIAVNACSAGDTGWACEHVQSLGLTPHPSLTRSGPLTYVGFWLLLTAPPATLVLGPPLLRVARRVPLLTWPFVVFVVFHSLVPHKEERFMLPVLPLFLLALAAVPSAAGERSARAAWRWSERWWLALHALALVLAITNQSQANLREAMRTLREDAGARAVISMGPEIHPFLLARPQLPVVRNAMPQAEWFQNMEGDLRAIGFPVNRVLAFAPDAEAVEGLMRGAGYDCDPPRQLPGWWLDRWVYRLNPEHNRRRAPILLWTCELPSMALAPSSSELERAAQPTPLIEGSRPGVSCSGQVSSGRGNPGRASK